MKSRKPILKGDKIMSISMEESINFYRKQIDFAKSQVVWCSGRIKLYGKNIKQENMKKERNKYYKERSYWRNMINEYEKKLVSMGDQVLAHIKMYDIQILISHHGGYDGRKEIK